jgi:four helix bundle suffix protein
MVQAARSGRQNIAEGSRASATSSQTELRLVNVARASLDELLLDYEDYLRQNGHAQWTKDSPEAMSVRLVGKNQPDRTDTSDLTEPYRPWLAHKNPEIVANAIICLIHQANYLLDRQIHALEQQFVKQGGYSEQLAAARLREREQQARSDQADRSDQTSSPICPICGGIMAVRTARKGPRAGAQFWGCVKYPACKGTKPL